MKDALNEGCSVTCRDCGVIQIKKRSLSASSRVICAFLILGLSQIPLALVFGKDAGAPPVIKSQPTNSILFVEDDATFEASIVSSSPPAYQWQFNGRSIPNATNAVLVLSKVQFMQTGTYRVVVKNPQGEITSEPATLSVIPRGALAQWTLRRQTSDAGGPPAVNGFYAGYAFGNNTHVIVGFQGAILTSTDARTWLRQSSPTTNNLHDITFAQGRFVAAGYGGTLLSGTNGSVWTAHAVPPEFPEGQVFIGVAFGNGTFLATTAFAGFTLVSTNGTDWTRGTGLSSLKVTYGNGLFIGVGFNGMIQTSPDSVKWTTRRPPAILQEPLYDVIAFKGRFIAVGNNGTLLTSSDGIQWTQQAMRTTDAFFSITRNDDLVVIGGGQRETGQSSILTSNDGTTWERRVSPSSFPIGRIGYGGGLFVALNGSEILTSPDGQRWRATGAQIALRGIVFGNDQFVAVGDNGTILTSNDGAVWAEQSNPATTHLNAVEFANGTYVAVGAGGTILSSSNATHWAERASGTSLNLSGIAFGNGLFAAVGGRSVPLDGSSRITEGVVVTSRDGVSWTVRSSTQGEGAPLDVAYSQGQFVSVGDLWVKVGTLGFANYTLNSADGVAWSRASFPVAPSAFPKVVFGKNMFVALDSFNGGLAVSSNGWTQTSLGTTVFGLSFGNDTFVATGSGAVFSSTNGFIWNRREAGTDAKLYDAAFGKNTFVVVGENETILQSAEFHDETGRPVLTAPIFARRQFQITIPTASGVQYILESKQSLEQSGWKPVATFRGDGTTLSITDPAPAMIQQFYRTRVQ
jgi:hypothetical protein